MHIRSLPHIALLLGVALSPALPGSEPSRVPVEFFVAADGYDGNPGTPGTPFGTLEGARDAVRALRAKGRRDVPVTVWIRGGVYYRTQTFELTEEDGGTRGAPVVYRAYGDEDVHLVGGKRIESSWWEPVRDVALRERLDPSARDGLIEVDLGAHGIRDYGEMSHCGPMFEVFCGGRRMPVARYPSQGWMHIGQVVQTPGSPGPRLVDGNKQGTTFQYDGDRPARWGSARDMQLHGFWWFGWMDEFVKVRNIDTARGEIRLDHVPCGGMRKNQWFRAVNLVEEIDEPGEWYLDRERGLLYFLPPEDEGALDTVYCSTLMEPLLALSGTSHVTVRDLTLEVTRGVGAVISGGEGNRLAGCVVRCIGTQALAVDGGPANGILGCDIHDVGTMGVRLTGGNRSTLAPSGNYVVNNHIHRYAQRKKVYMPAVRLYGAGHRVAHNLIHDAPHQAIGYDGNDHVIEFNEIHHVVMESADAGVLYTGCNWTFRGNVVRHNFIHHIPHGPGLGTVGVYLDDCASSTEIVGNVFYDMLKPTFIGGGRDCVISNNIFVECDTPVYLDNRGLRWDHFRPGGPMYEHLKQVRHDQAPWNKRYPALARILDECPQAPLGNVLANNVSVRSSWRDPEQHCRETSGNHVATPYMRIENNLVTDEDPGFVDAKALDFALREDSLVYDKIPEFKPIPFGAIGLYRDEYRATWPVAE